MQIPHQGSCLCGAVTYQVSGALKAVTHCHCHKCQKGHGAAFASYASTPRENLHVSDDGAALKGYESSPGVLRQFCGGCGSSLFWQETGGEYTQWISIAIATLDTPFTAPKQKHHCVAMKASWHQICDQYPQVP
ncbi:GFA family protein [Pseudomonas protegens]|uniref:GFA family protein n=1 Tax=Pseudomonas protegens TaxID=380021 RepID=A0A7G7XDV4_9PSED|nr:GFA family protein [Pseudomonas protegens]QNH78149.1 GFA family protein [Pseudomonas protegens]QNL07345.1 GFA family protein [Pseudomonas protegens]